MPPEYVRIIFILSWAALFGSLAMMYLVLRPGFLRTARIVFFMSCASVVLSAGMIGIQSFRDTARNKAIIIAQTVTAKSSPDAKAVDAFVIHEGVKVKLTDAVGGWVMATLADGKIGWIRQTNASAFNSASSDNKLYSPHSISCVCIASTNAVFFSKNQFYLSTEKSACGESLKNLHKILTGRCLLQYQISTRFLQRVI